MFVVLATIISMSFPIFNVMLALFGAIVYWHVKEKIGFGSPMMVNQIHIY
jgi:hypothetical protein